MLPSGRTAMKLATGGMSCLMLPQNGVVEYSSGVNSPQITMSSSIDACNGNAALKRPKNLDVSSSNGYATKNIGANSDDIEDGSLPCTPELMSDSEVDVSSCPAGDEVLENDTRQLLSQFLQDFSGLTKPRWCETKELSTMKRVVNDVLEKHRYAYNGMINKLSLDDKVDDVSFITAVAQSLFSDGTTNWGRIASLVAFGAAVCQHLKEKHRENCVDLVAQEISSYLLSAQRDWLVRNNSWDGFVEFFRVADPESTVRKSLMAFAGLAGIGASLALLIR